MKWGVVILLIFGVVAAACAALLVSMMNTGSRAKGSTRDIEVAVAKESLPAGELIKTDDFVKQMMSRNDLAQSRGQIADPATIIGRTLDQPVVEGQVLTENLFAPEGSVQQLLSQMPPGGRLFTLSLSPRSAPDRLFLYPGCVVDVLFSARLSGREAPGQALSTTMLQRLPVVAVQGESVVSDPKKEDKDQTRRPSGSLQVTFMVDQKQAEALQLISSNGDITLVVRNPLDKTVAKRIQATVYNQGRLASIGTDLSPDALTAAQKAQENQSQASPLASLFSGTGSGAKDANQPNGAVQTDSSSAPAAPSMTTQPAAVQSSQAAQGSHLTVTVIRGKETKNEEFKTSGGEAGAEK